MYSEDFRRQALSALEKGHSVRRVADDFGVNPGTIQNWKKTIVPKTGNNGRPPKIDIDKLRRDVELSPDDYQQERAVRFNCTQAAISYGLKRLNISKKTAQHPSACQVKRSHFQLVLKAYQNQQRNIVYLDESGFRADTYRPYGYAPRGQPCFGFHNWQLKNTTNAISAWCGEQLLAPVLLKGSVNADVFYAWIEQALLPELPENSVIVMDNATFHKRNDIREILEKAGHDILWLPPYSPDLNPIEEVWAWLKAARRRWRMKSIEDLFFYFVWTMNEQI